MAWSALDDSLHNSFTKIFTGAHGFNRFYSTGLALTSFSSKDFDRAGVRDSRYSHS